MWVSVPKFPEFLVLTSLTLKDETSGDRRIKKKTEKANMLHFYSFTDMFCCHGYVPCFSGGPFCAMLEKSFK